MSDESVARRLLNVQDARSRARRALPRVLFDYVDGGADDELTMRANIEAFRALAFRPRMAVEANDPSLFVSLFGGTLDLPVILAPCGLVRLVHPDGPAGVASAAACFGTISVLSTVAGVSLEEVARSLPDRSSGSGPLWFQLYAAGGRTVASSLIDRAAGAGYGALVVTVDTPVIGNRERDARHGVSSPIRITTGSAVHLGPQVLTKPVWTWRMLRDGVRLLGADRPRRDARDSEGPSVRTVSALASPFKWSDIEWVRGRWSAPLIVKGVLTAQDAERAVACGADGVIVSNHGGRQLDSAPATMRVLPEVVEAVGDDAEVLVDGGVRRGSDVVKAVALGARAVLIGRPYLYGLGAAGHTGVERVLEILRDEMSRTLSLLGCPGLHKLDPSWVQPAGVPPSG